jgi:hypothetical protein
MITKFWFVVVIAGSAVVWAGSPELLASEEKLSETSKHNETAALDYLLPVVYSSGKAVRVYYRAACHAGTEDRVPFPAVRVQSPSKDKTGVAAVREIFENDKNVTVTEEPVGTIRIWIGQVPTDFLQTQLSSVTFDPLQQYNPRDAIAAIESTKEVELAIRSLRLTEPLKLASTVAEPEKDLPHLPAVIKDLTMEQALDLIAKTWAGEGIVIYGVCAEPADSSREKPFFIDYHGGIVPKDD